MHRCVTSDVFVVSNVWLGTVLKQNLNDCAIFLLGCILKTICVCDEIQNFVRFITDLEKAKLYQAESVLYLREGEFGH